MSRYVLKWVNDAKGSNDPTERGYWHSADGRFEIAPNYRHTVYPDSYTVRDLASKTSDTNDTVRACKDWADRMATKADATACKRDAKFLEVRKDVVDALSEMIIDGKDDTTP